MDTKWKFCTNIKAQDELPESDPEDDTDNSLENNAADENPLLRRQVEDRIQQYGHKPSTYNHKLMKTLETTLKNNHMDLLSELYDCDHAKFHNEIDYEVSRPDNSGKYSSKLYAGLLYIYQRDEHKITWGKVLSALIKIPRWDVLKALCAPELDEYWNKGNFGGAKRAPECTSHSKQPVESLEMFGIPKNNSANDSPTNDLQDSGINSSPEHAITNSLSNMTISNDPRGATNPIAPNTNWNGNAIPQNQFPIAPMCYQWLQMAIPSLPTQANMQYVNSFMVNSAVMSQQQNMFSSLPPTYMFPRPPGVEPNSNSLPFQSSAMASSFSSAYSTLPMAPGSIPSNYCSPPATNVANNEMQMSNVNFAQRNEQNNCASAGIPRGVSPPEMDNIKIHVLLTYSRDAEQVAKELQVRLWEEFSILSMTAQEMSECMRHSLGEDIGMRCQEVKYVVPLLSKKYIADIGYGHLLDDNEYLSSLYDCDENKDDRNLVSSIYTHFVNMCFTEGGRNFKVRPVSVIANSFDIRKRLTPCLTNAWHLWRDFENFVRVISTGLNF